MGTSVAGAVGHRDDAPQPRAPYVGEDRRANPVPGEPFRFGLLAGALTVLVATAGAVAWARLVDATLPSPIDAEGLTRFLGVATAVLAVVAGLTSVVRWRLIGEASTLWAGTGILVFGLVTIGLSELLPGVYPDATSVSLLNALQPASRTVAVAVLLVAAIAPAVDTRLRPRNVMAMSLAAVALLTVVVDLLPGAVDSLRSTEGHSGFALMWAGVAAAHVWSAHRRQRRYHLTAGIMACGLSLAEAVAATGVALGVTADPGPGLLTMLAIGLVLMGSSRELEAAFVNQRAEMLEQALAAELANARRRADFAAHEERVHDARNAILAIDGAAQTLERFRDRLTGEQREALSHAVSEEIRRLQRLIEVDWEQEDCSGFPVAALLTSLATTERARGLRLTVEVPDDLAAVGRTADTAEVLRNLLDNARRYAPGSAVEIRAERDGDWIVVRVEDRGRGVRREEREAIFERGHRGSASDGTVGTGLGLFVSRRLMRDQGGDMWVEHRSGGGASFGICLPLSPAPALGPTPVSEATSPLQEVTA